MAHYPNLLCDVNSAGLVSPNFRAGYPPSTEPVPGQEGLNTHPPPSGESVDGPPSGLIQTTQPTLRSCSRSLDLDTRGVGVFVGNDLPAGATYMPVLGLDRVVTCYPPETPMKSRSSRFFYSTPVPWSWTPRSLLVV